MIAVIDVSGAIEIILQKEKRQLFGAKFMDASWVIAPDLYISELSNTLWKYYRRDVFSHDECVQHIEDGINMVDDFISGKELWKEALSEGIKNDHSVYDMHYAVLARRNDAVLITNDGPLAVICKDLKIGLCY